MALFGVAYWVVDTGWSGVSTSGKVVIASLIAAPVLLGLLWSRLSGFKAFGFEVSLSQAAVQVDISLAPAIGFAQPTSGPSDLITQIQRAIARPDIELVEVDLRDGNYWWSTRLFLLAALSDDFSSIQQLVFVEGGAKRIFVGLASPGSVRKALAASTTELETAYRLIADQPPPMVAGVDRVGNIVAQWTNRPFGEPRRAEKDFAVRVSPTGLHDALSAVGHPLMKASVEWPGIADAALVRALVCDFTAQYVALLRVGSLDRVVNRLELATRIATDSMMR